MDLPQRKNMRKCGYDYNDSGSYFITICRKNRNHYFGEISNHEMILNNLGKYARDCRMKIPNHFPFVTVGGFICMPDHIHGILTIKSGRDANTARPNNYQTNRRDAITARQMDHPDIQKYQDRTAHDAVPTCIHGPQYGSLGYIINQYKGSITKYANQNSIIFSRQSRFYDHIILNEIEYYFIEQYIKDNPKNR